MSAPIQPAQPGGVIHDIGYRKYDGPRLGRSAIVRALFGSALRSTYGLGRTAKSKVLPFILFGCMLIPALIIEVVLVVTKQIAEAQAGGGLPPALAEQFSHQPLAYSAYAIVTQAITGIYLASQAPQLFSRDLRFRTISLYFSRPLTRLDYVVAKFLALVGGLMIMLSAPILVMYIGGLFAKLPVGRETGDALKALLGVLILSLLLAGAGALISSLTVRRGFAVAGIITFGAIGYGVAGSLSGIGSALDNTAMQAVGGLLSPITLLDGVQYVLFDQASPMNLFKPEGGWALLYVGMTIVYIVGAFLLLLTRYRKVSGA